MHERFKLKSIFWYNVWQPGLVPSIYYVHHLGTEGFSHTPGSHPECANFHQKALITWEQFPEKAL